MRPCVFAMLVCAECAAFSMAAAQAGTTGGIQGLVTDSSLYPLPAVKVAAVSPSETSVATTDAHGFYALNGLPLDMYTVTLSKNGYASRSVPGINVVQDQSIRVDARLDPDVKTLARVSARSSTSLLQPTATADTYLISQQQISDINGTPQDLFGIFAFNSMPGVTPDSNGGPTIRAGAFIDVAYQVDGVENTDPVTGSFAKVPSLNGVRSVQLLTGGYDVSEGNTNSGVINEVIKRGTYPAHGQATVRIQGPIFDHELSFDFGAATPNNRFSYYFSHGGYRNAIQYGNGSTLLPLAINNIVFDTLNDQVLNLFYHFGHDNNDELQFLISPTSETFSNGYIIDPANAPYASNNGNVQAASDPFGLGQFPTFESSYATLFPGQATAAQNINAPDSTTYSTLVGKINFKRQLTSSSFVEARVTRTMVNQVGSYAYGSGAFSDFYVNLQTRGTGVAFDYTNQLGSRNELSFGAAHFYYANQFSNGNPSFEPVSEPLEAVGCPQAANALGVQRAGGCYIGPFNAALNGALGLGLPVDLAHAPLSTYASDFVYSNNPLHRWYAYAKDRWQPNERLTVTFGLRWDQESLSLPADAAQQNTTYFFDRTNPVGCGPPPAAPCNIVTVAGQPIGRDVTRPQQVSPRLAASFKISPRDALRFSYGKNIEFIPTSGIEHTLSVPDSLRNCTITNNCLLPLPGYGTTNQVTNLYQQVVLDLTTQGIEQFTPVLPQTAVNFDFSFEHEFGAGVEMRLTPYYRKGTNYAVAYAPLRFTLINGTPIFGAVRANNAGINENTGLEFALQRTSRFGLSGLIDATYDNTMANYDSDGLPFVNNAALLAGHFYHVTYVAPITATLNLAYTDHAGFHASTTVSYESGYRYGVGKKTFVFGPNGAPVQVLNTDLAFGAFAAYYLTNPSNPGTEFTPNIVASRGTPEGDDPGTLFSPAIAMVNLTLSHQVGRGTRNSEAGVRIENLFGNHSPTVIPPNPYYDFSGFGNHGLPSGFNPNACAPGQTFGCEPFRYNYGPFPYEKEQNGPPRVYTVFFSIKY